MACAAARTAIFAGEDQIPEFADLLLLGRRPASSSSRVTWFRDGQVVQSTRYHSTIADVSSFDSTDQPSFVVLNTWPCGSGDNCPDSTSPDVLDHQVDWVRVWTR